MKPLPRHLLPLVLTVGAFTYSGCSTPSPSGDRTYTSILDELSPRAEKGKSSANALPQLSGTLSVEDAVKLALANNRTLKAAYLARTEAEGRIMQAWSEALPNVSASASAQTDLPAESGSDTYTVGVEITQPLWRSGSVAVGLRYAKLYAVSRDFAIRRQVQDTIYAAVSQYMNVLLKQHLVSVYQESASSAGRFLQTTRSRRRQGTVSDYEVLRAEVEVANADADYIEARNALQTAIVSLFQTLGVSQDSDVTFAGELSYSAEAFDLSAASAQATISRADIAQSLAALRMAEEEVRGIRADYGPKADAFASGDYSNRIDDKWNDEWTIGARVSWTIFDGFERRGRMIASKALRDQAEEMLRDTEEKAHVEVVNALLRLRYADELYQSQKKNIDLAKEALRILETGASRGRNTQIEVLDARSAVTAAMGAYYNAIYAQGLARLGVRNAMGTLAPEDALDTIVKPSAVPEEGEPTPSSEPPDAPLHLPSL